MEKKKTQAKSIFDVIEEHSETPYVFAWSSDKTLLSPDYVLLEGELVTIKEDPYKFNANKYLLTSNALIRFMIKND